MKNFFLTSTLVVASISGAFAQADTIYSANKPIACTIREVTPDAVKFSYLGEDLINSLYKNTIQRIVYKSGRVETFAEQTNFRKVSSAVDWENVTISQVEAEVRGLYKVGEVSAKAKGTTVMSNMERVKERAFKKLKIQCAMTGGNVVYLTQLASNSAQYSAFGSTAAGANLSGVAYTNVLPDLAAFKRKIGDRKTFACTQRVKMWSSDADYSTSAYPANFLLADVTSEGGIIYVTGALDRVKANRFQVAHIDESGFTLLDEDKSTIYNYIIQY